ncbi:MAG TPA: MGMT family protein [Candidatus Ratteibacteria bacterium]|nr:MGMT family protein [Candidatus Ratteibacteria bacterium]
MELRKIKFGHTKTYSYIALKLGMKNNVRYISSILKENPYLISIPCHRVIKKNGEIGNYVLGKEFKKYLIEWENSFF